MNKKKILIVDDEENFTKLVRLNLEEGGKYEVIIESKGEYALEAIRRHKPDLIFLDIIMPDMQGDEIAQEISSDEAIKDIPLVFLTAIVTKKELDAQEGIVAGHRFLAKPVTKEQLIDCIEKNLRRIPGA